MSALQELFQRSAVWRIGDRPASLAAGLATGFPELDRELPDTGWPRGGLTEILCDHSGIGELALVLPALARLTGAGENAAWIAPPHLPYAPRLETEQVASQRLLLVRPEKPAVALWAAERVMRDGACAMAVLWLSGPVEYAALRRLQLAAAHGGCAAFLYRPRAAARSASPAPLRLELTPVRGRLAVNLLKRRGFANSRMVCLETASNRWAGMLERFAGQEGAQQQEQRGERRKEPREEQREEPREASSATPLPNFLNVRPRVPLVERRYPVPDR